MALAEVGPPAKEALPALQQINTELDGRDYNNLTLEERNLFASSALAIGMIDGTIVADNIPDSDTDLVERWQKQHEALLMIEEIGNRAAQDIERLERNASE